MPRSSTRPAYAAEDSWSSPRRCCLAGGTGVYLAARDSSATFVAPPPRPSDPPSAAATPSPTAPPASSRPHCVPDRSALVRDERSRHVRVRERRVAGRGHGGHPAHGTGSRSRPAPRCRWTSSPPLVDRTLGDPRSWIAGNDVRLQRVPGDAAGIDFTVLLVTPGTAQKLCLAGGPRHLLARRAVLVVPGRVAGGHQPQPVPEGGAELRRPGLGLRPVRDQPRGRARARATTTSCARARGSRPR